MAFLFTQISLGCHHGVTDGGYTEDMKNQRIAYDANGLGVMEMTALSLYHPAMFSIVFFLLNHHMSKLALLMARRII